MLSALSSQIRLGHTPAPFRLPIALSRGEPPFIALVIKDGIALGIVSPIGRDPAAAIEPQANVAACVRLHACAGNLTFGWTNFVDGVDRVSAGNVVVVGMLRNL